MCHRLRTVPAFLALLAGLVALAAPRPAAAESGAYAEGYADALLAQVYRLRDYDIAARGDTLEVTLRGAGAIDADKLARALLQAPGIRHVIVRQDDEVLADEQDDDVDGEAVDAGWEIFPGREAFSPLLADPRWPEFSAAYQHYIADEELGNVAPTSFGETFALLRSPHTRVGGFELGLQAGVFSLFDLDSDSFDLVNSDFMVGVTLTHALGDFATLLRLYHQSSHLGDEYLLRNRVDRVNLSYEVVDALVSYTPFNWLRLYGGGGLLVHRNPDLDPGLAQGGIELRSPVAFQSGHLRPIAGLDLQFRDESDWQTDVSTRFGLQIEHPTLHRLRLQLLGEYYRGHSPNGQFYARRIETLGIGIHFGF